jgi:hypothetical protein
MDQPPVTGGKSHPWWTAWIRERGISIRSSLVHRDLGVRSFAHVELAEPSFAGGSNRVTRSASHPMDR